MGLRDVLASDAAAFTNTADFGEPITYFDDGVGDGRSVNAVVFREEPDSNSDITIGARFHSAMIFVARNSINGVDAPTRADECTLSLRPGETAVRCRVVEVVATDAGGHMLRVTK